VGDAKATVFVVQGKPVELPVELTRGQAPRAALDITVTKLPPDVTADPLVIAAGATEGTLTVRAKATSARGPSTLEVKALEQGPPGQRRIGEASHVRAGRPRRPGHDVRALT
jgi:hypothetical protein